MVGKLIFRGFVTDASCAHLAKGYSKTIGRTVYSPVYQNDDSDPVAADSVVTAAAAPRDDDSDDGGDSDGGSRRKRRQSRAGPAAGDDEGGAISSPGHPPVLRLSVRAPLRRCSRSHPLQTELNVGLDQQPRHNRERVKSRDFHIRTFALKFT